MNKLDLLHQIENQFKDNIVISISEERDSLDLNDESIEPLIVTW